MMKRTATTLPALAALFLPGAAAALTITFAEPEARAALDGRPSAPAQFEYDGVRFDRARYYDDPSEPFDGFGIETYLPGFQDELQAAQITTTDRPSEVILDYSLPEGGEFALEVILPFEDDSFIAFRGVGSGTTRLEFDPDDSVFFLFFNTDRKKPARVSRLVVDPPAPIPLPATGAGLLTACALLLALRRRAA